jgi:hypothetical protein
MDRTAVIPFRVCLVAYALAATALVVKVLVLGHGPLPEAAVAYLRWWSEEPQSFLEQAVGWVGLITALVSIVCALAMTAFVRWTRPVFAVCILLAVGVEPLMDYPVLKTPGEYFLDTLLSVLAGATIVFSYWTQVNDRFAKSAP